MDLRRCPVEMLAGKSEISPRFIHLDWATTVVGAGQRGFDEDVQTGPGWRDFGVAIERVNYLPGPRRNLAGLRAAALVEVYAEIWVVLGEDEAHAAHPVLFGVGDGGVERRPRTPVGATS